MSHWIVLPVLIPAIIGPLIILAVRHDIVLARVFSVASNVLLLGVGCFLLAKAQGGETFSYALGNWSAPFGIILVVDRLSAMMVTLTATLSLFVLLYAINGWDKKGRHFHSLYQFQLMGINGAFLTGDFFNLFVFFEVLLISSYGLMIHGGGPARMKAGVQYVIVNLLGSAVFLFAAGLLYSVTGTLNMADLAMKVPQVPPGDQAILQIGAMLLLFVFVIKAALVPMHFWLPGTYSNAAAPVAALFAIMTKIGAYAIIRLFTLAFGPEAGESAFPAGQWLLPCALITGSLGAIGMLASRSLGQMVSYAVLTSIGTLFAAVSMFTPQAMSAALFYLLHSTLAAGAMFLIVDLVTARRGGVKDLLEVSPKFAGIGLIAPMFFLGAIAMAGMPPLSGFIGKLMILSGTRESATMAWIWPVILVTSFLAILAFARGGSTLFWKCYAKSQDGSFDSRKTVPGSLGFVAVSLLLASTVALTVFAGPVTSYVEKTSEQLFTPASYVNAVLQVAMEGSH